MSDEDKSKKQLLEELFDLRQHNYELKKLDSEYKRVLEELRQIHGELAIRVKVRTAELTKITEDLQKEILERSRIEESLRKSEEKFRTLYESCLDGIVFCDLDGNFLDANQAYLDMLGLSKDEITKLNYRQITPLAWHKTEEEIVKNQVSARGYSDEYEKEYIRKDGTVFPIAIRVWLIKDAQGNPQGMWGIVRDISETKRVEEELRKYQQHLEMLVHDRTEKLSISNEELQQEIAVHRSVEKALRESEEKYRSLFDIVPVGIGVADYDGNVLAANKNMLDMMGSSEDEVKTINIKDTYVDQDGRAQLLKALEETGRVEDWVTRLKRKDGTIYFAQLNIIQVELGGKKILLTAQRDITKQKQQEEELLQYHNSLETLVQERTAQLEMLNEELQHDIERRNRTEERITKINACLLNFGEDPLGNIALLTSLSGELLGAYCVLYSRLDKGLLYSIGEWNLPEGFNPVSKAEGRICYDVIRNADDKVVIIRNLSQTRYVKTDPNVSLYKFETYIGRVVKLDGECVGSLCAVYQNDFEPAEEDKRVFEIISTAIGVEERRKKTQEALRKLEQQKAIILDSTLDLIVYHDINMRILLANKAAGESVNMDPRELVGRYCWEIWHQRNKLCNLCPVNKALETGKAEKGEIISPDGRIWFIRGYPTFDEHGKVEGVVELCSDITERRQAEKKLEELNKELLKSNRKMKQLALRDPHTGLYNHRYLEEVIEAEFYRARRYAHPLSLIMLDIDYFKSINDVYGYQFGDLVLKQLTQQLKQMLRRYDIIIRFSGEEFIILSPGTEKSQALVLAQRLLDALSLYNFGDKEHRVKLKLSIAVSSYPEDKILKAFHLVELAEQMLTKIKEDGGNRVYSSSDLNKKRRLHPDNHERGAEVDLLKNKITKLNQEANQNLIEAIFAFAKTIEVKDRYTGEHVESTVAYATGIAKALDLPKDEIERIQQAAVLHDLGKIGISEKILLKHSKLSKKEFEIIKKHPQIGVDIIRPIKFLHSIISLIFYHHERWDGKGYPSGLRGEDIPIGARIIAIADVYQALISDRPYRKAFSKAQAVRIIKKGAGTQFDPHIVRVFLKILKKEK